MKSPRLFILALASALCAGVSAAKADSGVRVARAAGGEPTDIEEAPWLVQFMFMNEDGEPHPEHSCAGTIVDETHVLTAGHCFPIGFPQRDNPQEYMKILAGSTDKLKGGDVYSIESVVMHPKFNDEVEPNQKYDLAVVTVTEPIQFSNTVKAIQIAKKKVKANTTVFSGGWGGTTVDENFQPKDFAPTLKTVKMTKLSDKWCLNYMSRTNLHKEASKDMLCMKPRNGVLCVGDSGTGVWVPARGDKEAQLFGVLQGVAACTMKDGIPMIVDILNEDVRDFLEENGVL